LNAHWQSFTDDVPWFNERNERIVAGELTPPGRWRLPAPVAAAVPHLADLLASAHTSHVSVGARDYVLFSWETEAGIASWLSPRASPSPRDDLFPAHRALLTAFGGIAERSQEPETTWLLNTNESLTADEASHDATFIRSYEGMWADGPRRPDRPDGVLFDLARGQVVPARRGPDAPMAVRPRPRD